MDLTLDPDILKKWVGNKAGGSDKMLASKARLMQVTLDQPATLDDGDHLPPLWHWLYFASETPMSELGADGHRALGRFLPPVALPRRMWAGGRLRFDAPIQLGETVDKQSEVVSVEIKEGRRGRLCFVTVRHAIMVEGEQRWSEDHDIVYRDEPKAGEDQASGDDAPARSDWSKTIDPNPVMLFRYSALTFNGHRIHYDADFCRDHEGYPGLVVHGPLLATLLAGLAQTQTGRTLASFNFRAQSPVFNTAPFTIHGSMTDNDRAELWAATTDGHLAMRADAEFA